MEILYEVVMIDGKLTVQKVDLDRDDEPILYGLKSECEEYVKYMNNLNK